MTTSPMVEPSAEPFFAAGDPARPQGRTGVLLIHGFTGSPRSMRPWAEHLAGLGYAVAVPVLPGHGTTWQDLNTKRWADWQAAAIAAFEELRSRTDRVFVGGLSMGGALGIQLAQDRGEEVAGLILVNPGLTNTNPARHVRHLLKHVVPAFPAIKNDIKKPGVDEGAYDRTPLKAVASMMDAWKGLISGLPSISQPVLMFRSAEDHVVDPGSGRHIMEKVSSADLSEIVLENSYHVATLDHDAETIFADSVAFIERVSANAG